MDKEIISNDKKRKIETSMDDLNQDVLETVLSRLPTSSFLRLSTVSKRWRSVSSSATFRMACAGVAWREPWFVMLSDNDRVPRSLAFDAEHNTWLSLSCGDSLSVPVAANGGLVCRRDSFGNFSICNPITGFSVPVPPLCPEAVRDLQAVAMIKSSNKLAVVFGENPNLFFKLYDPKTGVWEHDTALKFREEEDKSEEDEESRSVYLVSKAGEVVSVTTGITERSPWKQYSSAAGEIDGEDYIYLMSSKSGRVISCNLTKKECREYPHLLPALSECSVDVVESGGRPLVVLLSEFCESAALRVWGFNEAANEWRQAAAMPAAMSHQWYGRRADVNCAAAGGRVVVCLSSAEGLFGCVVCDLERNLWTEIPSGDGDAVGFVSAFAFEPRIEASV